LARRTITVKTFPPGDVRHLEAAQGWLELGNHLEANEELEKITLTGALILTCSKCGGKLTPRRGSGLVTWTSVGR